MSQKISRLKPVKFPKEPAEEVSRWRKVDPKMFKEFWPTYLEENILVEIIKNQGLRACEEDGRNYSRSRSEGQGQEKWTTSCLEPASVFLKLIGQSQIMKMKERPPKKGHHFLKVKCETPKPITELVDLLWKHFCQRNWEFDASLSTFNWMKKISKITNRKITRRNCHLKDFYWNAEKYIVKQDVTVKPQNFAL